MEKWNVYDLDRQLTNKVAFRNKNLNENYFHLVVHAAFINSENKMLIQKRTISKDSFPNVWDLSAGGSALFGETSVQAMKRETKEEIGIDYNFKRPNFTVNFEKGFDDFYIVEKNDININELKLQVEEVEKVKWASLDEILQLVKNKDFVPYSEEMIRFIFFIKSKYTSLNRF